MKITTSILFEEEKKKTTTKTFPMLSLKLGVLQIPKLDWMIFHIFISVTINSFLPFYFHPVTLTQDMCQ